MGCGASSSKGKSRGGEKRAKDEPDPLAAGPGSISHVNLRIAKEFEALPPSTHNHKVPMTWLSEKKEGSFAYYMWTLSAKFESNTGPQVEVGLGVYSRGELSWAPLSDEKRKELSAVLKSAETLDITEVTMSPLRFFDSKTDAPLENLTAGVDTVEARFMVQPSTGEFLGMVGLDDAVDRAVKLVFKEQEISDATKQGQVLHAYMENMREVLGAKYESEVKRFWHALAHWPMAEKLCYAPAPGPFPGTLLLKRAHMPPQDSLVRECRENLTGALESYTKAEEAPQGENLGSLFRSEVVLSTLRMSEHEEVCVNEATMEPVSAATSKVVVAEYVVRGEPHYSASLHMRCAFFAPEQESAEATRRRGEVLRGFTHRCQDRYALLRGDHIGLTRQAELTIKDAFDAMDTDADGTVDSKELERVMLKVAPETTSQDVVKAMIALDKNKDGRIQWLELRNYIARQVTEEARAKQAGDAGIGIGGGGGGSTGSTGSGGGSGGSGGSSAGIGSGGGAGGAVVSPPMSSRGAKGFRLDATRFLNLGLEGLLYLGSMNQAAVQAKPYKFLLDRTTGILAWSMGLSPSGRVSLSHYTSCTADEEASPGRFKITLSNDLVDQTVKKPLILYARNAAEQAKWVGALLRAVDANAKYPAQDQIKDKMITVVADAVKLTCYR